MFWLISRGVVLPVRAAAGGFKLGFRTGRVLGYRRLVLVAVGAVIGLLVAPGPGAELRARIRARLDGGAGTAGEGWASYAPLDPATGRPVPGRAAWPAPGGSDPLPAPVLATRSAPGPVVPGVDPEVLPHPAPVTGEVPPPATGGPLPAAPDADPVAERPAP